MENREYNSFFSSLFGGLLSAENTGEIDNVVDLFLEKICQYYRLDLGEVYLLKDDYLILRGVYGIDRYYVCKVYFLVNIHSYIEDAIYKHQIYIGNNLNNLEKEVFAPYSSMLAIPIILCSKSIGIVVFRDIENKIDFYKSIIDEIKSFVEHFAIYANNILQSVKYEKRNKQLEEVRKLYLKLSFIDYFENNLNQLAFDIANIFETRKSFIRLKDKNNNFYTRSSYGFPDNFDYSIFDNYKYKSKYYDNNIYYINNISKNEDYDNFKGIINRSIIFNKMEINSDYIGYVVAIDKTTDAVNPLGYFDKYSLELFDALLTNIKFRIFEHSNLIKLNESNKINAKHMSRLNTLYDISSILLDRSKIEDILFLLLTVATIGDIFAFNRAFAFLYDKDFNVFRGKVCIAPKDAYDAGIIWNNMKYMDKYALREKLMLSLNKKSIEASWDLNQKFLNTIIPNNENCKLFFDVFNNKNSINIQNINNNYEVNQIKQYTNIFGDYPFAIVPIMDSINCIGIIVVDNPYNSKIIPYDDLNYLKMFGRQAAVALEYSLLYNMIEENNKEIEENKKKLLDLKSLAIIGEMSSSMQHNLRNFIVPISGFANRLIKVSKDENITKYAKIIIDEVKNLENYIQRNLSFAKSVNLELDDIKINDIIKYLTILSKEYIKKSGKSIKFYAVKVTKKNIIRLDYNRINEVIFNVIINAIEAINKKEEYSFISLVFADNSYDESLIDIIVENTNSYIEPKLAEKIFTPFFTTKSHGIGIGLAASNRIIEAHGGNMTMKSVKDIFSVTTFFIFIPVSLNN